MIIQYTAIAGNEQTVLQLRSAGESTCANPEYSYYYVIGLDYSKKLTSVQVGIAQDCPIASRTSYLSTESAQHFVL